MVKYSKISKWILGVGLVTITCNGLQIQAETKREKCEERITNGAGRNTEIC